WLGKGSQIRFNIQASPSTIRNIRYDSTPLLDLIAADHYKFKELRKNVVKNRKMNENFLVAKRKLKLKNVEKDIQANLIKKKVEIWHVRGYHE
ncbi:unnamed protein product, partial [Acanthoscelides obtectus]